MTALETELLRVLTAETAYPPMTAESLGRVLYALGWSPLPLEAEITATLEALLRDGWIEAVHSQRLGRRFRVMGHRPGVDLSEANSTSNERGGACT
jgi:hypothetical protein